MSWKSSLGLPNQSFGQTKIGPHRIHLSFIQERPEVFVGCLVYYKLTGYGLLRHPDLYGQNEVKIYGSGSR